MTAWIIKPCPHCGVPVVHENGQPAKHGARTGPGPAPSCDELAKAAVKKIDELQHYRPPDVLPEK